MRATAVLSMLWAAAAWANPVATYTFNGNCNAIEGGEPPLAAVVGTGGSAVFGTDTVFGGTHAIVDLEGSQGSGKNTGLQLGNATSVVPGSTYSIEYVFLFSQNPTGWRKIEDVANLGSDNGFYVDNSNSHLDAFGASLAGSTVWTNNVYHHVVLTDNSGTITAYLDGVQQFSGSGAILNIPAGNALSFFLDDANTSFNEYSSSKVALIRLFDSALTAGDVTTLYNNGSPIDLALGPAGGSAPEPSTAALLLSGLGVAYAVRRRGMARW